MALPDLLERLLTTPGPPGQERAAAAVWREAADSVGEVSSDALGSSWVRVPGTGGGPSLALVGHIDEIGMVVTHLGDDGLAALRPIGGFDPHVMLGQRVHVLARGGAISGIVGGRFQKRKRGEDRKPIDYEDLFLDVGTKDGDELRGLVRPGDVLVWHGAPVALPGEVIAVAAVQEEVGDFAGSRTTAFGIEPDVALAIDVTRATDIRGGDHEDEGKIVLGGGPTLTRGPTIHPDVFELLHDTAEAEGIPFGIEVTRGNTWTDADAVYLSRRGVPTGLVSIPLRYMHSPVETVDLGDVEAAVRLIVAFALGLKPGMSFAG